MRAAKQSAAYAPAAEPQQPLFTVQKKPESRWWEVRDAAGELVCITVYRRGAREVVRRLSASEVAA